MGPFPSVPVASYNTAAWDAQEIREPGAALYDPTTNQWIYTYSGNDTGEDAEIGAALSPTGLQGTWTPHPENPITGTTVEAEDPYIVKDITTGEVWRDSTGRALMFTEDEPSAARAIDMWQSDVNTLDGWIRFGRVIDKGGVGTWDATDIGSPIVFWDGAQLVMLYEGRSPGNLGEIGLAISVDEGETWAKSTDNPIIVRGGGGTWNELSVVTDDIILVGSEYILLVHGISASGAFFDVGRYSTSDLPGFWDDTSFTEMTGNPYSKNTNTVMCYGNDPSQIMWLDRLQRDAYIGVVLD